MHAKATANTADQDDAPAERGILFGVSMVRFILDGTKTQTRRVVSPQPYDRSTWSGRRPFGVPGDHLWVREMWRHDPDTGRIVYAADLDETQRLARRPWRPSLFMPRAASRITLEVQSIHMERLQSIREDDARAEGVPCVDGRYLGPPDVTGDAETFGTAVRAYAAWWSAANGPDAWDRNEWVWVIRFQRLVPS